MLPTIFLCVLAILNSLNVTTCSTITKHPTSVLVSHLPSGIGYLRPIHNNVTVANLTWMDVETVSGTVERITFNNPENGYTVLKIIPETRPPITRTGVIDPLVTVVGNLPEVSAGEYLVLSGKWVKHPQHGLQFMA